MKMWPTSLRGQVITTAALALLVAQGISAALLLRAAEERREAVMLNTAAFHLLTGDAMAGGREGRRALRRTFRADRGDRGGARRTDGPLTERGRDRLPPRLRYQVTAAPPLALAQGHASQFDRRIAGLLEERGLAVGHVATTLRDTTADPVLREAMERRPWLARRIGNRRVLVAAI
ncbi:MAG: two-component sensor histidine kinase, partial [Parerythrobacter sp.]